MVVWLDPSQGWFWSIWTLTLLNHTHRCQAAQETQSQNSALGMACPWPLAPFSALAFVAQTDGAQDRSLRTGAPGKTWIRGTSPRRELQRLLPR